MDEESSDDGKQRNTSPKSKLLSRRKRKAVNNVPTDRRLESILLDMSSDSPGSEQFKNEIINLLGTSKQPKVLFKPTEPKLKFRRSIAKRCFDKNNEAVSSMQMVSSTPMPKSQQMNGNETSLNISSITTSSSCKNYDAKDDNADVKLDISKPESPAKEEIYSVSSSVCFDQSINTNEVNDHKTNVNEANDHEIDENEIDENENKKNEKSDKPDEQLNRTIMRWRCLSAVERRLERATQRFTRFTFNKRASRSLASNHSESDSECSPVAESEPPPKRLPFITEDAEKCSVRCSEKGFDSHEKLHKMPSRKTMNIEVQTSQPIINQSRLSVITDCIARLERHLAACHKENHGEYKVNENKETNKQREHSPDCHKSIELNNGMLSNEPTKNDEKKINKKESLALNDIPSATPKETSKRRKHSSDCHESSALKNGVLSYEHTKNDGENVNKKESSVLKDFPLVTPKKKNKRSKRSDSHDSRALNNGVLSSELTKNDEENVNKQESSFMNDMPLVTLKETSKRRKHSPDCHESRALKNGVLSYEHTKNDGENVNKKESSVLKDVPLVTPKKTNKRGNHSLDFHENRAPNNGVLSNELTENDKENVNKQESSVFNDIPLVTPKETYTRRKRPRKDDMNNDDEEMSNVKESTDLNGVLFVTPREPRKHKNYATQSKMNSAKTRRRSERFSLTSEKESSHCMQLRHTSKCYQFDITQSDSKEQTLGDGDKKPWRFSPKSAKGAEKTASAKKKKPDKTDGKQKVNIIQHIIIPPEKPQYAEDDVRESSPSNLSDIMCSSNLKRRWSDKSKLNCSSVQVLSDSENHSEKVDVFNTIEEAHPLTEEPSSAQTPVEKSQKQQKSNNSKKQDKNNTTNTLVVTAQIESVPFSFRSELSHSPQKSSVASMNNSVVDKTDSQKLPKNESKASSINKATDLDEIKVLNNDRPTSDNEQSRRRRKNKQITEIPDSVETNSNKTGRMLRQRKLAVGSYYEGSKVSLDVITGIFKESSRGKLTEKSVSRRKTKTKTPAKKTTTRNPKKTDTLREEQEISDDSSIDKHKRRPKSAKKDRSKEKFVVPKTKETVSQKKKQETVIDSGIECNDKHQEANLVVSEIIDYVSEPEDAPTTTSKISNYVNIISHFKKRLPSSMKTNELSTGLMEILPGGKTALQQAMCYMAFTLIKGTADVILQDVQSRVGECEFFFVSKDTSYSIINNSEKDSVKLIYYSFK